MRITLAGVGMGGPGGMTGAVAQALSSADVVLGAERLLAGLPDESGKIRVPLATPDKVAAAIADHPEWQNVCVALSGDAGFYSGAKKLLELLGEYQPRVLPGISSPQYFAASLRRPWQDFRLVSAHGTDCDILAEVLNHPAVMFLTGGAITSAGIVDTLCQYGLENAGVTVGERLSYPDERVTTGTAEELRGQNFDSLSVVLVENSRTFTRDATTAGIADDAFERGKAPMTKREVRAAALALLQPGQDSILWDIGAGTGSVAVEMALQARRGRVYAVERDAEACRLIARNRLRFGTYNLLVVTGDAPAALADLPAPGAVFLGGTGGGMRECVDRALAKNPRARLVASAVTLETLSMAVAAMQEHKLEHLEVTQIAVSRTVARGGYHMLNALNPVFLISGGGCGDV